MEFNEKLQELRKQKNLTQEELAQSLYVSRAAVLLFILSRQVYAAVFCFIFFAIKAILYRKK